MLLRITVLVLVAWSTPTTSSAWAQPSPDQPSERPPNRWRIRLELGDLVGIAKTDTDHQLAFGVRASVDLIPALALQAGLGPEGVGAGLRLQYLTRRAWELWLDANVGFKGYDSLLDEWQLGVSAALGVSLEVNERFLIGPFLRYAHTFRSQRVDLDHMVFGIQMDLRIVRGHSEGTP